MLRRHPARQQCRSDVEYANSRSGRGGCHAKRDGSECIWNGFHDSRVCSDSREEWRRRDWQYAFRSELVHTPFNATYAASKHAALAVSDTARIELHKQGTQVIGVYAGFIDTEMAAARSGPKTAPAQVTARTLEGVESGLNHVWPMNAPGRFMMP
jgi:NAD(P)-dependent dehydrogenase (short-subunit alcohol dehydrogenase family)